MAGLIPPPDKEVKIMTTEIKKGRGFPPAEKMFKPGQSGNPKGRPKGSLNTSKLVKLIAEEKLEIVVNGKKFKLPKKQIALIKATNAACQGDFKALKMLLPEWKLNDAHEQAQEAQREALSNDDTAILDAYINQNKG